MRTNGVTRLGVVAYSATAFATYFLLNPTWSIVPGIYAKYYGLSLTAVASVVFITRLVDAFVDPIIGYLSDRHRAAGGLRKTWVMVGGVGLMVSAFFLYVPQGNIGLSYFLCCSIAFFVCWTLCEIPALAWGREMAQSSADRARVFGWRTGFIFAGHTIFFAVPFLPMTSGREFTPALMRVAFLLGVFGMVLSLALAFVFAPNGSAPCVPHSQESMRVRVASVFRNGPLLNFAIYLLLTGIGMAMWYGLMFLFLSSYLGYAEHMAMIFLVASVTGFASIPLCVRLIKRFGVKWMLVAAHTIFMLMLGLSALLSRDSSWVMGLMLMCAGFIVLAMTNVAQLAFLADVTDYGAWKFKIDGGATYFALFALMNKGNYAIGVALALWIAGLYSFDPAAATQTIKAIRGLHLAYSIVPIALTAIGTIALMRAPLNPRRMGVLKRWHAQRDGRAEDSTRGCISASSGTSAISRRA